MTETKDRWITLEPKFLEPAVLGEVHVVGEMTAVQVELLLQQALAHWQRNH